MIYIYYYDFQLQIDILVVFNCIQQYTVNITIFSVLAIYLLIELILFPLLKVSNPFQE